MPRVYRVIICLPPDGALRREIPRRAYETVVINGRQTLGCFRADRGRRLGDGPNDRHTSAATYVVVTIEIRIKGPQ
jgi:hypothetical protein